MPAVSAESWGAQLGLTPTDLFGFEGRLATGAHYALLDGIRGSFLLSMVNGEEELTSHYKNWAWSANVRHHVAIDDNSVTVTAPTQTKKERFKLSQVELVLDKFFRYLESDESTPAANVIDHFVRLFRSHVAATDAEVGCDAPRLASFLSLLAQDMFAENEDQQAEFGRQADLDAAIGPTIREAYAQRFHETLQINPITQLRLALPIALRHAGGALFQETHAEVFSTNQLTLFGLPAAQRTSLNLRSGAYYTPPGLARAVAELAIQPHLLKPEIALLDPACGSGLFLCEAVRALQRAGYQGTIQVYGLDVDQAAVQMAKFALACALADWPGRFRFEVRQVDFLRLSPLPRADVVVMNPPFRKWEMLQPEEKSAIAESLGSLYKGRPDLAMAFVSNALECLTDDGTLGTLLPLGILSSESALKWRQSLLEKGNLRFISSLGDHSLFSNAIVSVTTMILDRGQRDPDRQMSLLWASERPRAASDALRHFRRNLVGGGSLDERAADWAFYRLKQEDFSKRTVWLPLPNSIGPLLKKISAACSNSVSDIFDVRQGIRTGCRDAFILDEKALSELPKPERKYFWPVAENQTISHNTIRTGRYIFYGVSIISEADLIDKCPTYRTRYLLPNLDKLRTRKGVSSERYWHLTRPRGWLSKREPRLVSKMFGTTDAFALDMEGSFAIVQANAWIPKRRKIARNEDNLTGSPQGRFAETFVLQSYLELLNSYVFYMIVREYSVLVAGGQYELAPKYVKAIPMPNLWSLFDRDPYASDLANLAIETKAPEVRGTARDRFAAYAYGTALEEWPESD